MKSYATAAIILLLALRAAFGGEAAVRAENGWVRLVPDSLTDSAAFMTLVNSGDQPVRLTGGHTDLANMVMPMVTTRNNVNGTEVIGMKPVEALVVPAHGRLVLTPGGDHLMLMHVKRHPKAGEKVRLTLEFGQGKDQLMVELPVSLTQP